MITQRHKGTKMERHRRSRFPIPRQRHAETWQWQGGFAATSGIFVSLRLCVRNIHHATAS